VTHVGEKFSFRAIGRFCGFFCALALNNLGLQIPGSILDDSAQAASLDHSSQHGANLRHQLQEELIWGLRGVGKELENGGDVTARYYGKGEACS
jgi:hypothetical protein